jgi:hypothetical protein
MEDLKWRCSRSFIFLIALSVSPFLLFSLLVIVVSFYFNNSLVWIGLFPLSLFAIYFFYALVKDVMDSVYQYVFMDEFGISLKKFFKRTTVSIEFKDISNISFEWNRNLRFILRKGARSITYKNKKFNDTDISGQSDRNAGGKNLVIKMCNGSIFKIYDHQFKNSEALFNEIIERTRKVSKEQ